MLISTYRPCWMSSSFRFQRNSSWLRIESEMKTIARNCVRWTLVYLRQFVWFLRSLHDIDSTLYFYCRASKCTFVHIKRMGFHILITPNINGLIGIAPAMLNTSNLRSSSLLFNQSSAIFTNITKRWATNLGGRACRSNSGPKGKRRGVKIGHGDIAHVNDIVLRQCGFKYKPGSNVRFSSQIDLLIATKDCHWTRSHFQCRMHRNRRVL